MRWKKNWYVAHRWLGLLVGLQLLAWSIGGFTFSILHIENVRGELDMRRQEEPPLELDDIRVSPQQAIERASSVLGPSRSIRKVVLRDRRGRIVYELLGANNEPLALVDATDGEVTQRISEGEAKAVALADFLHDAKVASIALLEGEPPLEYRGGRMPVYQVILDHPKKPHFYVCPVTGQVLKRRNKIWRIFDFFWMLHTMDYRGRDDFNHWLLTCASALAIATSASGIILWTWRVPWKRLRLQRSQHSNRPVSNP